MSCCGPTTIGASCDDQINYGESIDLEFTYKNDDDTPIDLTSTTVSVFSSTPAVIKDAATVTVTDAVNGKVRFFLDRTNALLLRRGRNNRFTLQAIFGSQSDDVTPDIYIQVS